MSDFSNHSRPGAQRPIPAFAPARGGDDLTEARRFVDAAVDQMRLLHVEDTPAVNAWLDAVEGFARPLQARAIIRAVARARAATDTRRLAGDLTIVGSLIAQYEQGLVDVEAQLEAGEVIVEDEIEASIPVPAPTRSAEERFEEARQTLAGLLPVVDTHGHFDALETLVAFRPPIVELQQDALQARIAPATVRTADHTIDIDAFLPGLADHAQRMARLHGKPVTVSYATDNALLPASLAAEWQAAVETALTALAETTLEPPTVRRAKGLALSAHIDMTARGMGDGVELLIRCPGSRPPRMVVDAPHSLEAREEDGTITLRFLARREDGSIGTAREGAA